MQVVREWDWDGNHYRRTADAWLANLDANRDQALQALRSCVSTENADRDLQRWRMFFLAVAEVFGYCNGQEWLVVHYLLESKRP